jgi:U3 small nucleolar RNA-associated protein 10
MNAAEEPVVSALVSLVLKLSEASFRPLFFQLYDWATRVTDTRKERLVTFYNFTMQIAEKLKGLFVVFAGHFIRNAAQVIVDTNFTQKGSLPFKGPHAEGNTLMLLEYVLRCLYRVCLHDNENFINKERFETLMEPLVDQLENQLGEDDVVNRRVKDLLVPLLAQMAVAASDDYLWKALHYQLLLKTRSNSPHVRLGSLSGLSALVEKLGEDYLALLPEAIPFLAELLEDDVNEVEVAAQTTIANMENMLGEPLQKYF